MKKYLIVILCLCLAAAGVGGIGVLKSLAPDVPGTETAYRDGVIGGNGGAGKPSGIFGGLFDREAAPAAVDSAPMPVSGDYSIKTDTLMPEGVVGGVPGPWGQTEIHAGMLTAREWSDFRNLQDFLDFIAKEDAAEVLARRSLAYGNIVKVTGLNPLVPVRLLAGQEVLFEAVSNIRGEAVLISAEDRTGGSVTLDAGGALQAVVLTGKVTEVNLGGMTDAKADQLDLMLMIDTTGSMGDELEYLKKELQNVVEAVYALNPGMSIRVSVNFYRDEGDEYVVKYYDFREDVKDAVELLSSQYSAGGGDYPEAVHTALDNAVFGHDWRPGAVKLCYLVLDAPPHDDGEYAYDERGGSQGRLVSGINESLKKSAAGAAKLGIRMIPVVASGTNKDLETLGRGWALQTGGTYIYLTNDSGIGFYHEKPDTPETQLEYLNDCMIRVTAEYCGLTYEAQSYPEPSEWEGPTGWERDPWIGITDPTPGYPSEER
ncbi:MAG: VWA domain-containing protein [Lachnospiraceae bacterium]|nr:VWA domain-containing protein [Lachnospiraceae bacterium]